MPRIPPEKPLGGRYKIISQLGVGGFGRTFLAEDFHLPGHPRCVIKHLKPQSKSDDTLQMARRCFDIEAQVLYHLGSHDQIPRLLAHFEENQEFYLAQEFIEGDPLTRELAEGRPWSQKRVVLLLKDVLQVLRFVHQQQVIHRDLKPSNLIRRRRDQRIVVIDFGAVKQVSEPKFDLESGLTNLTISIGTQGYMPNEQLAGKPRYCSDIYALGVLVVQMLTGVHPRNFRDDSDGEIDWQGQAPQVGPELKAIVDRMVRYDFRERFVDAAEVLAALDGLPDSILEAEDDWPDNSDNHPVNGVNGAEMTASAASAQRSAATQTQNRTSPATPHWSDQMTNAYLEHSQGKDIIAPLEEPMSTAIWQSDPMAQPLSGAGSGLTQAIGRPHLAADSHLSPTESGMHGFTRRLTQPWVLVGILATSLLLTLGHLAFPQFGNQLFGLNSTTNATNNPDNPNTTSLSPEEQAIAKVKEAEQLGRQQQYEQALARYDQAIALEADYAPAYAGRCETLNQLNRPDEAIVSCNDALAYQANYPEAIWSQGNARLLQKRPYEALKLYEQVTEQEPDFAPGWTRRGVALQQLGRSAEALTALDRAIKLERNGAEAWITKGEALLNLQRYDEALTALNKALQLKPNDSKILKLREQARKK